VPCPSRAPSGQFFSFSRSSLYSTPHTFCVPFIRFHSVSAPLRPAHKARFQDVPPVEPSGRSFAPSPFPPSSVHICQRLPETLYKRWAWTSFTEFFFFSRSQPSAEQHLLRAFVYLAVVGHLPFSLCFPLLTCFSTCILSFPCARPRAKILPWYSRNTLHFSVGP